MAEFIKADAVFVNQSVTTRDDMLRFIADKAAELDIVSDASATYEALVAREEMGETGMTDGFAVPHAKSAAIKVPAALVVKNDRAIEWPSFDGKPVSVAIALLVPDGEAGTEHIRLLSKTAVLLMKDGFKSLLRGTDDAQAIADALNAGLAEE